MYLGLEVSASHIHARYPTHATLFTLHVHIYYEYGTFTLYGCAVPGDFLFVDLGKNVTTSPSVSIRDSACPIPFSFATNHGISLISFPPPTKMLQFGGFPFAYANELMVQEVPLGDLRIKGIHAPTRSLSQLVTTFIGTRAEPFSRWGVASQIHDNTPCIPIGVQTCQ